ncbi:DUF2252 family protein [Methylobacterium oryzae CBMB20]
MLGNLGALAAPDGRIDIQIRDLDQTVVASNPAFDLVRLALSLGHRGARRGAARHRHRPDEVDGHGGRLRRQDRRIPQGPNRASNRPEIVVTTKRRALGLALAPPLARAPEGQEPPRLRPGQPDFFDLDADESAASPAALIGAPEIRRPCPGALGSAADDAEIRLLDAAYWIKGCSSLGACATPSWWRVLGGDRPQLALLDVKEAVPHLAPAAAGIAVPSDHAERVVAGARAPSPNLGDRMVAGHVGDRAGGTPVTVRELLPQDLKIDAEQFSRGEAVRVSRPPRRHPGPGPRPPDGRGRPPGLDRRRAGAGAGPRRPRLALVRGHRPDGRAPARLPGAIAAASPGRRWTRPGSRPRRGALPPRRRLTPSPPSPTPRARRPPRRIPGRPVIRWR